MEMFLKEFILMYPYFLKEVLSENFAFVYWLFNVENPLKSVFRI